MLSIRMFKLCAESIYKTLNLIFKSCLETDQFGNTCINQFLAITHKIYKSFDACLDIRAMFLDMSKAFDKVWHQCLLYRLKQNGIMGNFAGNFN